MKRKNGNHMRQREGPIEYLALMKTVKSLKVWHEFSSVHKESGVGSSICLMCLNLRNAALWCVMACKLVERVGREGNEHGL